MSSETSESMSAEFAQQQIRMSLAASAALLQAQLSSDTLVLQARVCRSFFNALVKEGFSDGQALDLACSILGGKRSGGE